MRPATIFTLIHPILFILHAQTGYSAVLVPGTLLHSLILGLASGRYQEIHPGQINSSPALVHCRAATSSVRL